MSNTINVNYVTGMVNSLARAVTQKAATDTPVGVKLVLNSITDKAKG